MDETTQENTAISGVLEARRRHVAAGRTRDLTGRIAALRRLEAGLVERREGFFGALEADLGKPEIEAFLAEYHFLLEEIRHVCKRLHGWLRPKRAAAPFYFLPSRNRVAREPFGVVLVLAPWNYPLQLALGPLIAAVAAGNSVVLKPSEMAPASAAFLGELIVSCFDAGHVTVCNGGVAVAEELLEQRFDFIFFTGSTAVGRTVAQKAALHLTPCVLELGGKCPCVVDRDVEVEVAARRILAGKLFNAGQTCFAPDFVVVHREVREDLAQALESLLMELPWEEELAKVVNERHFDRLQALIGGREIRKGDDDRERLHVAPRILPEAQWDDAVMQQEVFGPVLPLVEFADGAELIDRLKAMPSPLALYVFSKDRDFTEALMEQIRSGSVCINDVGKQATNLNMPFGGVGASGHGRYRGRAGVESFTYERSVTKRYFIRDVFEALPPRAGQLAFLKKWMK